MRITIEELLALNLSERAWIRNLPPLLAEMARAIGVEATLRVALHYGGTNMYLPGWASDRTECDVDAPKAWGVTKVIGEEAAIKLADAFSAGFTRTIQVPNSLHGNVYRRLIAVAMFEKGATVRDVCQSVGVSRSRASDWKRDFVDPEVSRARVETHSGYIKAVNLITSGLSRSEVLAQGVSNGAYYRALNSIKSGRVPADVSKRDREIAKGFEIEAPSKPVEADGDLIATIGADQP